MFPKLAVLSNSSEATCARRRTMDCITTRVESLSSRRVKHWRARLRTLRSAGANGPVGGVEVHVVPGNHANLIYEPHVEILAKKLTACLNQAQSAEAEEIGAPGKIDRMTTATAFDPWIACRKPNPQARLRLFCFPYAGTGASIFRTWSDGLPADVEVCPVQFPGRGTRLMETPFTQLEPLVASPRPSLGSTLGQAICLLRP